jgi:hypothetical protein
MQAVNEEYARRAKEGIASGDQAYAQANLHALQKSLDQRMAFSNGLAPAKEAAEKNIDLALEASKNVSRTGSKWMNERILGAVRGVVPHESLSDFEVKVYTAIREYAKVSTGSFNSVAELSAASVAAAEKLFSSAQDGMTFAAAAQAMKDDMNSVATSQTDQIAFIQKQIREITNPRAAKAEAGAAAAPAPRVAAKQGEWRMINGKPHQWNGQQWAPGTPPSGGK